MRGFVFHETRGGGRFRRSLPEAPVMAAGGHDAATSHCALFSSREEADAFGEACRRWEDVDPRPTTLTPPSGGRVLLRVDGRAFRTFTKGLRWPMDERLHACMRAAAEAILTEFEGELAFVASDEITVLLSPSPPFGARARKIETLAASIASVAFVRAMDERIEERRGWADVAFDARAWCVPTPEACVDSFRWRQDDCIRNSVSNLYRHVAGKRDGSAAVSVARKLARLEAEEETHRWRSCPAWFRQGAFLRRRAITSDLSEDELRRIPEAYRPSGPVTRKRIVCVSDDWVPLRWMRNPVAVLLEEAVPDPLTDLSVLASATDE